MTMLREKKNSIWNQMRQDKDIDDMIFEDVYKRQEPHSADPKGTASRGAFFNISPGGPL